MTNSYPVIPQGLYSMLKQGFINVDLILQMRTTYGDAQVMAAIRNGQREFLGSESAQQVNRSGNRHQALVSMLQMWSSPDQLDDYILKIDEISKDDGYGNTNYSDTIRFLKERSLEEMRSYKEQLR